MRIVLKIKPVDNVPLNYPREYIRNWVYSFFRNGEFAFVHNDKYKHFCFSNIFPYQDGIDYFSPDHTYSLIISSPIRNLLRKISTSIASDKQMQLGKYKFNIVGIKSLEPFDRYQRLITATPVIVRIPRHLFDKYNIQESKRDYKFWDNKEFLSAFYEAVMKNTVRRYNDYCMITNKSQIIDIETFSGNLFSSMKLKKVVYGWDKHFTGTLWDFIVSRQWQDSDLIKYLYNAGIGERNASSGSGFVNVLPINNE